MYQQDLRVFIESRKATANKQRQLPQIGRLHPEAKPTEPDADTSQQEAEIDKLIYELYGLTAEEVAAVKISGWRF